MVETVAQYAYRAQKSLSVRTGHPEYTLSPYLQSEITGAKTFKYAPTGQMLAYIVGTGIHIIPTGDDTSAGSASTSGSTPAFTISEPITLSTASSTIDLAFSPSGRYFFTWERLTQAEEGKSTPKNLRVFWLGLGNGQIVEIAGFTQKAYDQWQPLMTQAETHLIRTNSSTEISIFALHPPVSLESTAPQPDSEDLRSRAEAFGLDRPVSKIKVDGQIRALFLSSARSSPLMEGSEGIAIWLAEYKGQPGLVSLYTLQQLLNAGGEGKQGSLPMTLARKNFFKGDKVVLKWSANGKTALFLCQSDVDNSGKSYYGETNLYLISLDGSYECKVQLDKEGPIYDFAWNPNSREFGVVYGFMPARTVLFDVKANPVHSFGSLPRNFLSYQPQGRLFISAGFGNLTGTVDIHDLRTRKLVCQFQAPNSTTCEWSPCGRYILTGTLSPRLRVDNGVKVWWCSGGLMHAQNIDELYQIAWRPGPVSAFPPFPQEIPTAPAPSSTAASHTPTNTPLAPKPTGAYRPPGARGSVTPNIFKREDEGGAPSQPPGGAANGTANQAFQPSRRRHVPGAPIPGAENGANGVANGKQSKKGKKNAVASPAGTPAGSAPPTPSVEAVAPESSADAEAEATQKKIRNLSKKLKAIAELKEKKAGGESLEATQIKKIEGEKTILKELASLEATLKK